MYSQLEGSEKVYDCAYATPLTSTDPKKTGGRHEQNKANKAKCKKPKKLKKAKKATLGPQGARSENKKQKILSRKQKETNEQRAHSRNQGAKCVANSNEK